MPLPALQSVNVYTPTYGLDQHRRRCHRIFRVPGQSCQLPGCLRVASLSGCEGTISDLPTRLKGTSVKWRLQSYPECEHDVEHDIHYLLIVGAKVKTVNKWQSLHSIRFERCPIQMLVVTAAALSPFDWAGTEDFRGRLFMTAGFCN